MTQENIANPAPLELFSSKLDGVVRVDGHYRGLCKNHDDRNTSLDFGWDGEKQTVWFHCWVCGSDKATKEAILGKRGLRFSDLYQNGSGSKNAVHKRIVATYDYTDLAGNLIHQTVRYQPKDFKQRVP